MVLEIDVQILLVPRRPAWFTHFCIAVGGESHESLVVVTQCCILANKPTNANQQSPWGPCELGIYVHWKAKSIIAAFEFRSLIHVKLRGIIVLTSETYQGIYEWQCTSNSGIAKIKGTNLQ
eukprot:scaffold74183_cov17-Prasinocladus_malaysianus.AAC.1